MGQLSYSDYDLMVREKHQIPDDSDTKDWCEENGLDYQGELLKAFSESEKFAGDIRELLKALSEKKKEERRKQ